VREHIKALGDYGIGLKRIAKMANVSNSTLGKIIYGDRTRNCAPRSRVERRVAEAVLAIKPDLKLLGNTVAVDGTGTRRRIQALITIGWSQSRLAARLGMTPGNFGKMFNSANVQAETARRVKDMYDELWNQPQIGTDQRSKISANRAMNYAKARGWVPPLAWDDETIDDPDATPSERGETNFIHAEDRMETIEFLLETGCGQGELVTRAGYKSLKALEKACYRQQRNDLVYRVKRIREMERAA
jgi:transcriptional regulator with XRE-family HTH domain